MDQSQQGPQAPPTVLQATVDRIHLGLNQASGGLWDQIKPSWEAGSMWDYIQPVADLRWVRLAFECPASGNASSHAFDLDPQVRTLLQKHLNPSGEGMRHQVSQYESKAVCGESEPVLTTVGLTRLLTAAGHQQPFWEARNIMKNAGTTIPVGQFENALSQSNPAPVEKARSQGWVHEFACRLHPSQESLAGHVYTASDDYKRLVRTLVHRDKALGGYAGKWEDLFQDHAVKDTCFDDQRLVLGPDKLAGLLKAAGYHGGLSMVEANKILKLPDGTIGVMDYDHFCKTFKDS